MTMISPERYADGIKDLSYEKLAAAERLLSSERARLHGSKGYAVEEIEKNMRAAIKKVRPRKMRIQQIRKGDSNNEQLVHN